MNEIDTTKTGVIQTTFAYLSEHILSKRLVPVNDKAQPSTPHTTKVLRVLSTASSGLSLISCLVSFYVYFAWNRRNLKFRHRLIIFLLIFDLLKSIAIIIYPILTFITNIDSNKYAINFLGFFTATAIEGADLAILTFALYSLISIYYPQDGQKWLDSKRYYIYTASFVIPLVLASIAFVDNVGYQAVRIYCYLPASPIWYRLALSWGPRYVIMIAILIIYFYIYFYVRSQLKKLEEDLNLRIMDVSCNTIKPTKDQGKVKLNPLEKFTNWALNIDTEENEPFRSRSSTQTAAPGLTSETEAGQPLQANDSPLNFDINLQLQMNNQIRLKNRYKQISRQLKEIFLYPLAYFLLWIFPLISQVDVMRNTPTSFGISILRTFFLPLNGFVDTLVFFYREKPWQYTYENYDVYHTHDKIDYYDLEIPQWRLWLRWLPMYGIPAEYFHAKEIQSRSDTGDTVLDMETRKMSDFTTFSGQISMVSNGVGKNKDCNNLSSIDDEDFDEEVDFLDILRAGPGGQYS